MFGVGNVTRSEATTGLQNVENILSEGSLVNIRAPTLSQMPERRILCLEAGSEWIYPTAGFNPDDENSAVGIFFQVLGAVLFSLQNSLLGLSRLSYLDLNGITVQVGRENSISNVLLELFTLVAKEQHFNQLRTVEQLGYFVDLYEKYEF